MKTTKMLTILVLALGLISCGGQVTFAGSIIGWGLDNNGQATPPNGNDFVAIASGMYHNVALRSNGSLAGWGRNIAGESEPPPGNDFVAVAAGFYFGLAIKSDGSIVGWGDGSGANPPAGNDYVAVDGGYRFGLGLKSDGSIIGWGLNDNGQTDPCEGNDFVAIAAGSEHGLALKADGSLVGWGKNNFGQINVPAGNDFVAISTFHAWNVALKSDGSIVGWGCCDASPPAGSNYAAVSVGGGQGLAIKTDGSIVGWGTNDNGKADPPAGTDFIAIATGQNHSLALTQSFVSTKFTYQGQLMNGGTTADGIYDFEFKLFREPIINVQEGNAVVLDNIDVIDGQFTVVLDFGNDANVFAGKERWLEVTVRPGDSNDANDFVVLSPRQEVTPTPYAQVASTALGLRIAGTETHAVYVDPNGNVGIGTTNPVSWLDVSPSPGTTGKEIFRAFSPADADYIASDVAVIQGGPTSDYTGTVLKVQSRKSDNSEYALLNVRNAVETAPSSKFYVGGDGNIGIGTENPAGKLHIVDSLSGLTVPLFLSNEDTTNGNSAMLLFRSKDTGGLQQNFGGIKAAYLSHSAGAIQGRLDFHVSNPAGSVDTPKVSILQNGNVGIGTTSPTQKLDVAANITASRYYDRDNTGYYVDPADTSYFSTLYASSAYAYIFYDRSNSAYYVDPASTGISAKFAGDVGIGLGTASPTEELDVGGDVKAYRYLDRNNSSYYVDPTSTSYLSSLNVQGSLTVQGAVDMDNINDYSTCGDYVHISNSGRLGVCLSSKRYKENITPLQDDFSKILEAQPVAFTFKKSKEPGIGFIAEDIDELGLRNLVNYDTQGRPRSIRYELTCLYLLEVLKDQANSIKELKVENELLKEQLKAENQSLKQRLGALETTVQQIAKAKEVQL